MFELNIKELKTLKKLHRNLCYTLSFFVFLSFEFSYAQIKDDIDIFFTTGRDVIFSPTKFDRDDWINLSATTAITSFTFLIDEPIKKLVKENRTDFSNKIFAIDDFYHLESMGIMMGGIYFTGLIQKNERNRNLGLKLLQSTAYTAGATLLFKFLIGRERPTESDESMSFSPFNTKWNFNSIPSGHSSLAFAFSTIMANEHNNFFWKFCWYTLSSLTAIARIHNNHHWLSDTIAGAALGYFIGEFVSNHKSNKYSTDSPTQFSFTINF